MAATKKLVGFYGIGLAFVAACVVGMIYHTLLPFLLPAVLAIGLLLLFNADRLIMLTAFLVPISIGVQDLGMGAGLIFPTEPIIILLMLAAILKWAYEGFGNMDFIKHPITVLLLINLAWIFITSLTSTMPLVSFKYLIARLWYILVFFFFAQKLFMNTEKGVRFLWLFLISSAALITFILIRHSTHGFSRDAVFTIIQPFFWIHGVYAAMIALCIPLFFILAWKGKLFEYTALKRSFLFTCGVIFIVAVIYSYTRAAWLSVLAAGAAGMVIVMRFPLKLLYALVLVALVGLFYYQGDIMMKLSRNKTGSNSKSMEKHLQSATNIRNDPSNLERINRWSCAYRMFKDKPITGFGPGTYMFQYAPYQLSYQKTVISTNFGTLGHAHSEWLGPLAESGLMGMLSWFAVFIIAFIRAVHLSYYAIDPRIRYLSLAVFLSLLTYFVHGFLNSYFDYDKIAVPFWAMMSMLVCMDLNDKKSKKEIASNSL